LNHVNDHSGKNHEQSPQGEISSSGNKQSCPAKNRNDGGQRVQPHLIRQSRRGPAPPQNHHAHGLPDKLHEQPHRENRLDHRPQPEKQAEHERRAAKKQQRNVRETLRRMHARENGKEISVARRRIRHARVAQQRGKN
jgi:hypothetical protein